MAYKRGLPFVSFLNMDIVISPLEINLREALGSFEFVDELGDERERVVVSDHMFIQVPIILYHPFPTVLLQYEEYG